MDGSGAKMKRISILWLCSILIAFVSGYQLHSLLSGKSLSQTVPSDDTTGTKNVTSATIDVTTNQLEQQALTTGQSIPTPENQLAFDEKPDIESLVMDIKQLMGGQGFSTNFKGIAEAYSLLQKFNEDDLLQTLQTHFTSNGNLQSGNAIVLFLNEYAQRNPLAAIAFIEENVNAPLVKTVAMQSALSIWAERDPLAALNWYQSQAQKGGSNNIFNGLSRSLTGIFAGLAISDMALAINKLSSLDESELRSATMGVTRTISTQQEFEDLMLNGDVLNNKSLQSAIAMSWGTYNPRGLASWIDENPNLERASQIRNQTLSIWMMSSPRESADWYMQSASEENRRQKLVSVVDSWSRISTESALQWLKEQNPVDNQDAMERLLSTFVRTNHDIAIANIEQLDDIKRKTNILYRVYTDKHRTNPSEAEAFLADSPYQQEILEKQAQVQQMKEDNQRKRNQ